MRLTNYMREAFIRAALDDVPRVDYREQMQVAATKAAVDFLPPKVRAIYDDKELRDYLNTTYIEQFCVPGINAGQELKLAVKAAIKPALALAAAQQQRDDDLRRKIKACAYAAATRAALVKMLPEFERYLPADDQAACRTLPVVANVVAEFVKAGWPKGKKKGQDAPPA